jgi:hypothetical protein
MKLSIKLFGTLSGALFVEGDESAAQEAAFRHAIDLVNADRNVLVRSRLTAHIEKIPHGDSFRASQKGNKLPKTSLIIFLSRLKISFIA